MESIKRPDYEAYRGGPIVVTAACGIMALSACHKNTGEETGDFPSDIGVIGADVLGRVIGDIEDTGLEHEDEMDSSDFGVCSEGIYNELSVEIVDRTSENVRELVYGVCSPSGVMLRIEGGNVLALSVDPILGNNFSASINEGNICASTILANLDAVAIADDDYGLEQVQVDGLASMLYSENESEFDVHIRHYYGVRLPELFDKVESVYTFQNSHGLWMTRFDIASEEEEGLFIEPEGSEDFSRVIVLTYMIGSEARMIWGFDNRGLIYSSDPVVYGLTDEITNLWAETLHLISDREVLSVDSEFDTSVDVGVDDASFYDITLGDVCLDTENDAIDE